MPATKKDEQAAPAEPVVVEELTVDRADQAAVLTVNGQRFLLSPTDVASARKALEAVGYELY